MSTVLITGATGGLGRSLAHRLVRDHDFDHVVLGVRNAERGEALRDELTHETGARFSVAVIDVASPAAVRATVDSLATSVDAAVLNAGGTGGRTPFALTADGVTQIAADNIVGHVALTDALLAKGLLTGVVELVGSEAARGVRRLRIPTPEIVEGTAAEFASWVDGSSPASGALAYGRVKLLGSLWVAALARRHPEVRALSMSPGNTAGTGVNRDLPLPLRLVLPRVAPLLGLNHPLEVGTERLAQGVIDTSFGDGRFYASAAGRVTGPVVDQAPIVRALADAAVQDAADEALHRFTGVATPRR